MFCIIENERSVVNPMTEPNEMAEMSREKLPDLSLLVRHKR